MTEPETEPGTTATDDALDLQPTANADEVADADTDTDDDAEHLDDVDDSGRLDKIDAGIEADGD